MDIKSIIKDIFDDVEINTDRQNDFRGFLQESQHTSGRSTEGFGILPIYIPQLIGAAVGLAIARLFSGGAALYIFLGVICAFAFGTWKSYEYDKIDLKRALIRNGILLVPPIAIAIIFIYVLL